MANPTAADCFAMGMTCACYNLRRAARAVTQVFDAYFEDVGLKATQFTVLAALAYEQDNDPTVSDLASAIVLEQSSLSRNLAVLERKGWLRLVPGADRRERIVRLTPAGRKALARGLPAWKAAQKAIGETLEERELERQLRSLRRMTQGALALRPSDPGTTRSTARKTARKTGLRAS
ncbi:MAG: winged helix-turn-helix transcriptional regulator [Labilithrix sp.]|nr:winged helix-turn-helix transcriptional regulator [Labilithrix sp.]